VRVIVALVGMLVLPRASPAQLTRRDSAEVRSRAEREANDFVALSRYYRESSETFAWGLPTKPSELAVARARGI
jgi:hypothetical protein